MWNKLKYIYGSDDNVRRAKAESLRGQFDHMKMREDKNIAKYVERIKASGGDIDDKTIVSKVFKNILPIYAIRMFVIQEMRCDVNRNITLDALVGRLTTFELDKYDNYVPSLQKY